MKDIDIRRFGSEFFTIDESNLPSDPDTVKEAIISEAFRFALDSVPDPQGSIRKMHIHSIRRWVIQKLRAIIPEIEKRDLDLLSDILKESKGPNLLFIGDILELSKGYYSPAPTRVVNMDENNWILVSGLPTYYFTEAGLNINVKGVGRIIKNTDRSEIEELAIPIQSKESYVALMEFDESFLLNLLKAEAGQVWRPERDWQGYNARAEGLWSVRDRGFLWWGSPTNIRTDLGFVSFWRGKPEYGPYEYWLKTETGERESMISVPSRFYKQICLIFDEIGGSGRVVKFEKLDRDYRLNIDFSPPKSQTRWLHAVGAKFERFNEGKINWIVPSKAVKSTAEVFEMLSVKTIIQNE
ncbi:hypothetical protein C5S32_03645 [ANME-1 cluster archaeon GoMg1]|nr:hypothetical protein [ANME-1 cluster archaeon GoMg1]